VASFVKNLKPPFYAAIINDKKNSNFFDDEISPTDKMISIAPHQPGFLGLETTIDRHGKWETISYWSDIDSEKSWEYKSDIQIRKQFGGIALNDTCAIRVSKINYKVRSSKMLYSDTRFFPKIMMLSSTGAFIIGSFFVISHMFDQKAVH
jgi:hypothetical protein